LRKNGKYHLGVNPIQILFFISSKYHFALSSGKFGANLSWQAGEKVSGKYHGGEGDKNRCSLPARDVINDNRKREGFLPSFQGSMKSPVLAMSAVLLLASLFPLPGELSVYPHMTIAPLTAALTSSLFLLAVEAFEPGFISPLENITAAAGRSAHFTCVVKHLGGHKVAWLRSDSKAILAIHTHMVTNNPRMSVEHNGHNSWTLRLANVQRNDSGVYMCQINTEPMTSQVIATCGCAGGKVFHFYAGNWKRQGGRRKIYGVSHGRL